MLTTSHHEGPSSTSDQSMCDLWGKKVTMGKVFVPVLLLPLSVTNYHSTSAHSAGTPDTLEAAVPKHSVSYCDKRKFFSAHAIKRYGSAHS